MSKTPCSKSNKQRIFKTVTISVVSFILFISIVLFTYKYKEGLSIPAIAALAISGLVILSIGIWTVMQGGRTTGYFYCSKCNEKFVPSIRSYMCTAHVWRKCYLKCPKCGEKNWCKKNMV